MMFPLKLSFLISIFFKIYHSKYNEKLRVDNNKKRSHTQLDSRKQVIAFQDRVITINIKEAQHPLKWEKQVIDKSSIMLKISTKSMHLQISFPYTSLQQLGCIFSSVFEKIANKVFWHHHCINKMCEQVFGRNIFRKLSAIWIFLQISIYFHVSEKLTLLS